jgi:cystathionine beta-synthase
VPFCAARPGRAPLSAGWVHPKNAPPAARATASRRRTPIAGRIDDPGGYTARMTATPTSPGSSAATGRSDGPVYSSVLEMIGHTPMLELRRLDTGPCRLFAKLELMNPAGSIKDRIGLSMIEAAEADGRLNPNADPKPTIIEATAGNTGLGLALVAGQRGYRMIVVVPDKMSEEKIQHLRAMGAQVMLTRSDVQKGHPEYYQDVAAALAARTPNSVFINQFANPANAEAHYQTTGPEIWRQIQSATGGPVDALVVGVGSGGTLTGIARALREQNPALKVVLADPQGSILADVVNKGMDPKDLHAGSWLVEGMGEDFIPDVCDLSLCDEAITVTDAQAFMAGRQLLAREGVLAGSSTGCLIHAATQWCQRQTRPMNVVTFVCDHGAKYLSKMFNDFWMSDHGFIERERFGDLRDLIGRLHHKREDFTLNEDEPVRLAIKRMQMYSVSQMVVLDAKSSVVGILDESDILLAINQSDGALDRPVSDYMTRRLEKIAPSEPVGALMPIFRADRVAIVMDEQNRFYGLITKIDMINYLRKQLNN